MSRRSLILVAALALAACAHKRIIVAESAATMAFPHSWQEDQFGVQAAAPVAPVIAPATAAAQADALSVALDSEARESAGGYAPVGEHLRANPSARMTDWNATLEAGRCYLFIGAGSDGVEALFLYVWGPDGRRVADLRTRTPRPKLTYCAQASGPHHLQAKIAQGIGDYRVAVFIQGASVATRPTAPPPSPPPPAAPPPPPPPPPPRAAAHAKADPAAAAEHNRAGAAYFSAKMYEKALRQFAAAYENLPLPETLYQVALCHYQLGHKSDAEDLFEKFIALVPDGEQSADARSKLKELGRR
jgi:tetratricopeptide (TPR) repeat protein